MSSKLLFTFIVYIIVAFILVSPALLLITTSTLRMRKESLAEVENTIDTQFEEKIKTVYVELQFYTNNRMLVSLPIFAVFGRENSSDYTISICLTVFNRSDDRDSILVEGIGWHDFNISKLLKSEEYPCLPASTDVGPPLMDIKFRSGEIGYAAINMSGDLAGCLCVGPGAHIENESWLATYVTIKDPFIKFVGGSKVIYNITFMLKFVFYNRSETWISNLIVDTLHEDKSIEIKISRINETYYIVEMHIPNNR
ncbi:MAG TPA: hypothetical protein ENG54_01415 [Thermofilum sp.]|nr:hypothetical protein [Thermofilum sp.]